MLEDEDCTAAILKQSHLITNLQFSKDAISCPLYNGEGLTRRAAVAQMCSGFHTGVGQPAPAANRGRFCLGLQAHFIQCGRLAGELIANCPDRNRVRMNWYRVLRLNDPAGTMVTCLVMLLAALREYCHSNGVGQKAVGYRAAWLRHEALQAE